ncbi:MAG: c-type cytochrome [candidate division KSB1 bacterium]|nr:c-type cytochrome [candidate division KSB1 bacterium]MDZ7334336.1 c-type cytochrome [candidate division KSB1 bacterium]MDZ7356377.1 c-type cytochrome [candidate division KSB1 bacterium]MDZ7399315.1 c-type cytochrome [candidate division KSB1 bacterium]
MKKQRIAVIDTNEISILAERKALDRGKAIWFNTKLGANGFSCESCHESGMDTNAELYPRYKHILRTVATLSMTHNFAVVRESKGKPWELGGEDANALALFVTSFANGKPMRMTEPKSIHKQWIARGDSIFHDVNLGTNQRSCAACHEPTKNKSREFAEAEKGPFLRGIAARYPRYRHELGRVVTLEQQINYCIETRQCGAPLALDSQQIVALCCYLAHLSHGRKIAVAK